MKKIIFLAFAFIGFVSFNIHVFCLHYETKEYSELITIKKYIGVAQKDKDYLTELTASVQVNQKTNSTLFGDNLDSDSDAQMKRLSESVIRSLNAKDGVILSLIDVALAQNKVIIEFSKDRATKIIDIHNITEETIEELTLVRDEKKASFEKFYPYSIWSLFE